jgi:hypothetical protein
MTPQELQDNLRQFTGTQNYHRWSVLFRNFVMTDGVKFLSDEAGAYWLSDAIASHYGSYKKEGFVVANLMKDKGKWDLLLTDGDEHTLASQEIGYSDFPLEEISLYVIPQEIEDGSKLWVILLCSEY